MRSKYPCTGSPDSPYRFVPNTRSEPIASNQYGSFHCSTPGTEPCKLVNHAGQF